jgi:NFU1 iron-sulfur cluster scaffold homolog, mitochondrial
MQTVQNLISIYSEATPNPETMKFVSNRYILPDASLEFTDAVSAAAGSPLAAKLFEFPFVQGVFIASNFVTITKKADEDWFELTPILKDFVKSYLEAGMPIVAEKTVEVDTSNDTETVKRIRQILADYIQPAVEQDGGAISYKHFDEQSGVVTVSLQGSCSGCPSSMITLKAGIENLLKRMLPEVTEVVADSN